MKLVGIIFGAAMVAGCAADMEGNPARATRAVESPTERNSAHGEMVQMADMQGLPLVEVGLPNTRNERPVVRTVVDNIVNPLPPETTTTIVRPTTPPGIITGTTTQPTTEPTTRPAEPRGVRVDTLIGPGE